MIDHITIHVDSDEMLAENMKGVGYTGNDLESFGAYRLNEYLKYHPNARVITIESRQYKQERHEMDDGKSYWRTVTFLDLSVWLERKL